MVESLLPTREAENGSACFHCCQPPQRGNTKGLQRCNACRAVKYCGRACQVSVQASEKEPSYIVVLMDTRLLADGGLEEEPQAGV